MHGIQADPNNDETEDNADFDTSLWLFHPTAGIQYNIERSELAHLLRRKIETMFGMHTILKDVYWEQHRFTNQNAYEYAEVHVPLYDILQWLPSIVHQGRLHFIFKLWNSSYYTGAYLRQNGDMTHLNVETPLTFISEIEPSQAQSHPVVYFCTRQNNPERPTVFLTQPTQVGTTHFRKLTFVKCDFVFERNAVDSVSIDVLALHGVVREGAKVCRHNIQELHVRGHPLRNFMANYPRCNKFVITIEDAIDQSQKNEIQAMLRNNHPVHIYVNIPSTISGDYTLSCLKYLSMMHELLFTWSPGTDPVYANEWVSPSA